jgi:hypothetical protein
MNDQIDLNGISQLEATHELCTNSDLNIKRVSTMDIKSESMEASPVVEKCEWNIVTHIAFGNRF